MATAHDAPLAYRLFQRVVWCALRIFARLDVSGLENVPRHGPLIVAPNHLHILDSIIIASLIPRHQSVFVADKWQDTPGGWVMEIAANTIYVARGEPDRRALTQALQVLRSGGALAIAPEGTRSRSGGLLTGKDGAAYLASRSGAPILPVVAWGQETTFSAWRHCRRPHIHIRIARPIRLPPDASRARTAELKTCTDQLMLTLARMLPAAYRGVYAARITESQQSNL